jgi:YggT family protein
VAFCAKRRIGFGGILGGHGLRRSGRAARVSAPGCFWRFSTNMDVVLLPLLQILSIAIELYIWALIISAILSWLVAFNVVNTSNRFVYTVGDVLWRITEPALRPLRRIIPIMGGIDLSPIALILVLYFVQGVLRQLAFRIAAGV